MHLLSASKKTFPKSLLALSLAAAAGASHASSALPEVNVTADFREASVVDIPSSITVISEKTIADRSATHLEELLNVAPNVNFSSGASRGRFYQIRGIGARSQYKEPLDSSVGLVVDGIDFSNLGLAAGLMDVDQVEVLRGPQGTRYGSNAMAGMINIKTQDPTDTFEGKVNATLGNYGTSTLGAVLSGGLSETVNGRLAAQRHRSDGYMENDFLGRDDISNINETAVRAKIQWQTTDDLTTEVGLTYLNIDNGYDAFSLTHDRHTRSDQPGEDKQESTALSVKFTWDGSDTYLLEVLSGFEHSAMNYNFDWDWSDWNSVGVRGFEQNRRKRDATTLDVRALSKPGQQFLGAGWVAGVYVYDRTVDFNYLDDSDYYGASSSMFTSDFDSRRYATYGELEWPLNDRLNVTLGARFERFDNEYNDTYDVSGNTADNLWGGSVSIDYLLTDNTMIYATLSRGYKTGGINTDAMAKALSSGDPATIAFLNQNLNYDAEKLDNLEVGLKGSYLDDTLTANLSAFYMDRKEMQAKVSLEIATANWTEYRTNIEGGKNLGMELELNWTASDQLTLFGSFGLLNTELGDLVIEDVDTGNYVSQDGRDQAHAPSYQYNVGTTFTPTSSLAFTLQADGKDAFYFSNSHDQQSESYTLIHTNITYTHQDLTFSLWARNLTDEDYETRGFYWANNPNNGWINESYTQLGEPRTFGVSLTYTL